MSHEAKIHQTQTILLRELLFLPSARFSELQEKTGLESDQVKFHIARLVELGYLQKLENGYRLTPLGKEYSNKLDTDRNQIERQPKSAVILVVHNDEGKLLVQERLKHPYYGFWGFAGGKIRWGETILEAGARELQEETGLTADLEYKGVYHELTRSKETNEVLEDKIFQIIAGTIPTGEMFDAFDGGRNEWLSIDEIRGLEKVYKSFDIEYEVGMGIKTFVEHEQVYGQEEF